MRTSDPWVSGPMADLSDDSGSEDEDEKRRLKMAKEIARRQSEPATNLNFPAKSRSKKASGLRIRSPPPPSASASASATGNRDRDRSRRSSSSTEEDGEIIQEGKSSWVLVVAILAHDSMTWFFNRSLPPISPTWGRRLPAQHLRRWHRAGQGFEPRTVCSSLTPIKPPSTTIASNLMKGKQPRTTVITE